MDGLRFALILAGIALVAVVYFITARNRRRDLHISEFNPSGAWSDDAVDPLLDDLPVRKSVGDDLENTAINPRLFREAGTSQISTPPESQAATEVQESQEDPGGEGDITPSATIGAPPAEEVSTLEDIPDAREPLLGRDSQAETSRSDRHGVRVLPEIDAISGTVKDNREPRLGSLDALDIETESAPVAKAKPKAPKKKPAPRKTAATKKPPSGADARAEHANVEPLVIVINIMAHGDARFPGVDVEAALEEAGLRFGAMQLYHFRSDAQPEGTLPVFTALNTVKPGTLSPEEFPEMHTPGIAMVLRLPGVEEPARAFELMYKACKSVSEYLGGMLCDESRSHLTPQALNHLREQITEYGRRLRIPSQ